VIRGARVTPIRGTLGHFDGLRSPKISVYRARIRKIRRIESLRKKNYKPITLGVVTAHFLPTFAYLVQKVGDLCGKTH
jgi:hypothetical protein